jgi:hypothetical protein
MRVNRVEIAESGAIPWENYRTADPHSWSLDAIGRKKEMRVLSILQNVSLRILAGELGPSVGDVIELEWNNPENDHISENAYVFLDSTPRFRADSEFPISASLKCFFDDYHDRKSFRDFTSDFCTSITNFLSAGEISWFVQSSSSFECLFLTRDSALLHPSAFLDNQLINTIMTKSCEAVNDKQFRNLVNCRGCQCYLPRNLGEISLCRPFWASMFWAVCKPINFSFSIVEACHRSVHCVVIWGCEFAITYHIDRPSSLRFTQIILLILTTRSFPMNGSVEKDQCLWSQLIGLSAKWLDFDACSQTLTQPPELSWDSFLIIYSILRERRSEIAIFFLSCSVGYFQKWSISIGDYLHYFLIMGWSKSLCGIPLSPPVVKIQAFDHNMMNHNISQMKCWYCVRNQFNGSFFRRQFRRDIRKIKSGDLSETEPHIWSGFSLSGYRDTWAARFRSGRASVEDDERSGWRPVTVFQMQFPVVWIKIVTLPLEKFPRTCLFQRLQFSVFWMKWVWDSALREGSLI